MVPPVIRIAPAAADALRAALAAFRADELDAAATHAQHAAEDASAPLRAEAATLQARIARRQGRLDVALATSTQAIQAALAAADPALECRARVQQVHALNALGLVEPALEEAYRALHPVQDGGDPAAQAAAAEALAGVQWAMSQWPEALQSFERMLSLARRAGDVELQAVACGGLASVEGQLARRPGVADPRAGFERAFVHVGEYLRLATELGDVHAVRSARHNQAVALMALGDRAGARRTLQAVLAGAGASEARAMSLLNLADLDLGDDDPVAALARLQTAHRLLQSTADAGYLMSCCRMLCDAHEALGDHAAALAWHRRFHAHYVQMSSERAQMHARALAVKHETGRAQAAAEAERLRAEHYQRAALEDGLTGIANRRAFDQALADALRRAGEGRPFALALLDLDHFKRINDSHSHQVGDEVLRRLGRVLAASCRRHDVAARYGGEEFALVLADVEAEVAAEVCERVRAAVEREPWHEVSAGLAVRVSIGCVHVGHGERPADARTLLSQADRRLYAAKAGGRNRVMCEAAAA